MLNTRSSLTVLFVEDVLMHKKFCFTLVIGNTSIYMEHLVCITIMIYRNISQWFMYEQRVVQKLTIKASTSRNTYYLLIIRFESMYLLMIKIQQ